MFAKSNVKNICYALSVVITVIFLAGCADLTVKNVTWNDTLKQGHAVVKNIGSAAATHDFRVYFNADDTISQNHIPQISKTVSAPFLPGQSISYDVDFMPLAHPDNNYLGNFHSITVVVDPKHEVKESNENNNVMNSGSGATSTFACNIQSGGIGLSSPGGSAGGGTSGPSNSTVDFNITNTGPSGMGQIHFADFTLGTISPSQSWPSLTESETVQLLNGRGSYDFATGDFVSLVFDVLVTNSAGSTVSSASHTFAGKTSVPLTVPVGSTSFAGVNVELHTEPTWTIEMGGVYLGDLRIAMCPLTTFTDSP